MIQQLAPHTIFAFHTVVNSIPFIFYCLLFIKKKTSNFSTEKQRVHYCLNLLYCVQNYLICCYLAEKFLSQPSPLWEQRGPNRGANVQNSWSGFPHSYIYSRSTPFLLKTSQLIKVYNSSGSLDIVIIFVVTKRERKSQFCFHEPKV